MEWIKGIFSTDWLHVLLKKIDYNRYAWVMGGVWVVIILGLLCCKGPRATSPYTGQPATESEITAQATQFAADQAQKAAQSEAEILAKIAELDGQKQALLARQQGETIALAAQANAKKELTQNALAEIERQKQLWAEALDQLKGMAVSAAGPYALPVSILANLVLGSMTLATKLDKGRSDARIVVLNDQVQSAPAPVTPGAG